MRRRGKRRMRKRAVKQEKTCSESRRFLVGTCNSIFFSPLFTVFNVIKRHLLCCAMCWLFTSTHGIVSQLSTRRFTFRLVVFAESAKLITMKSCFSKQMLCFLLTYLSTNKHTRSEIELCFLLINRAQETFLQERTLARDTFTFFCQFRT